jgi:hypothetical protein
LLSDIAMKRRNAIMNREELFEKVKTVEKLQSTDSVLSKVKGFGSYFMSKVVGDGNKVDASK